MPTSPDRYRYRLDLFPSYALSSLVPCLSSRPFVCLPASPETYQEAGVFFEGAGPIRDDVADGGAGGSEGCRSSRPGDAAGHVWFACRVIYILRSIRAVFRYQHQKPAVCPVVRRHQLHGFHVVHLVTAFALSLPYLYLVSRSSPFCVCLEQASELRAVSAALGLCKSFRRCSGCSGRSLCAGSGCVVLCACGGWVGFHVRGIREGRGGGHGE